MTRTEEKRTEHQSRNNLRIDRRPLAGWALEARVEGARLAMRRQKNPFQ